MTGWVRHLNYDCQAAAMAIYVGVLSLIITIVPAQFFFRYHAMG